MVPNTVPNTADSSLVCPDTVWFPYDMHSQCKLLAPYVEALLDRGHELTIIHAFQDCDVLRRVHSIHVKDKYKAELTDFGN